MVSATRGTVYEPPFSMFCTCTSLVMWALIDTKVIDRSSAVCTHCWLLSNDYSVDSSALKRFASFHVQVPGIFVFVPFAVADAGIHFSRIRRGDTRAITCTADEWSCVRQTVYQGAREAALRDH